MNASFYQRKKRKEHLQKSIKQAKTEPVSPVREGEGEESSPSASPNYSHVSRKRAIKLINQHLARSVRQYEQEEQKKRKTKEEIELDNMLRH